jgi:transcriptional regulator
MYLPAAFAESDPAVCAGLIRAHPLGLLITPSRSGPDPAAARSVSANPIPWHLDEGAGTDPTGWRLVGHVARANPVWRDADAAAEALVVFQGPQAYVSPAWYPGKREHGKVVPTWNYATVQVRGRLVIHDDPAWLHALVSRLTDHHEAAMPTPWAVDDAPSDYVQQMLAAIVGVEIEVTAVTGKFKLSQNRGRADQEGVEQGLSTLDTPGSQAVARAMAARRG